MTLLYLLYHLWTGSDASLESVRIADGHTTLVLRNMTPGNWTAERLRTWHHYAGNPVRDESRRDGLSMAPSAGARESGGRMCGIQRCAW